MSRLLLRYRIHLRLTVDDVPFRAAAARLRLSALLDVPAVRPAHSLREHSLGFKEPSFLHSCRETKFVRPARGVVDAVSMHRQTDFGCSDALCMIAWLAKPSLGLKASFRSSEKAWRKRVDSERELLSLEQQVPRLFAGARWRLLKLEILFFPLPPSLFFAGRKQSHTRQKKTCFGGCAWEPAKSALTVSFTRQSADCHDASAACMQVRADVAGNLGTACRSPCHFPNCHNGPRAQSDPGEKQNSISSRPLARRHLRTLLQCSLTLLHHLRNFTII